MPTYSARAASGERDHWSALAKSNTSSAVAAASGATSRGPRGNVPPRGEQVPQRHLAAHTVAVGVHVRGERHAPSGRQHGRYGLRGACPLRGDRHSVRSHGIKIKQTTSRGGVARRRRETTSTPRDGHLAPMNDTVCGFAPVTARRPLTESVFCWSMNLPGTSTSTGKPETFTTPVT